MQFIITATDEPVSANEMEIDNYKKVNFPVKLNKGDILKYEGGTSAIQYDKTWHKIAEFPVDPKQMTLKSGKHRLQFYGRFENVDENPAVGVELIFEGGSEVIRQ